MYVVVKFSYEALLIEQVVLAEMRNMKKVSRANFGQWLVHCSQFTGKTATAEFSSENLLHLTGCIRNGRRDHIAIYLRRDCFEETAAEFKFITAAGTTGDCRFCKNKMSKKIMTHSYLSCTQVTPKKTLVSLECHLLTKQTEKHSPSLDTIITHCRFN